MTSEDIRNKFLEFFKERGHAIVPSSSLIPDDPSVLLTTAGMQQFKPYYTGDADPLKDFGSRNTASVQKCFRTSDIDEVGDESHLTFFEMLGNFSFGGYFKEKAIEYGYELITGKDWMDLSIDHVTIFDPAKVPADDWRKGVPFDAESEKLWKKYGVKIEKDGTDVFWGPTGNEGPCGPTTEIYVKNANGNAIEVWNIVFNEFYCDKNRKLTPLKTPGVDTGMGLERLVMAVQKKPTLFETDLFTPIISLLPEEIGTRTRRILSDHIRGIAFLISDGVQPSNKETGYILRRLIRRSLTYFYLAKLTPIFPDLFGSLVDNYHPFYPELNKNLILKVVEEESSEFQRPLKQGLKEVEHRLAIDKTILSGENLNSSAEIKTLAKGTRNFSAGLLAFELSQNIGFPRDISRELFAAAGYDIKDFDRGFSAKFARHQEISRAGVEKKFGGHGLILDTGELKAGSEDELKKVTRLHTATHLLNQALREVLGPEVSQRGSDITTERTRFDFNFGRKMTPEELKKAEEIVNEKISEDLPVSFKEMPKTEAEKTGALYFFKAKYPDVVKVYFVGRSLDSAWSKEFCGGPHVTHTGEIGKFKILKEEASSAGVRRIRATVE